MQNNSTKTQRPVNRVDIWTPWGVQSAPATKTAQTKRRRRRVAKSEAGTSAGGGRAA